MALSAPPERLTQGRPVLFLSGTTHLCIIHACDSRRLSKEWGNAIFLHNVQTTYLVSWSFDVSNESAHTGATVNIGGNQANESRDLYSQMHLF